MSIQLEAMKKAGDVIAAASIGDAAEVARLIDEGKLDPSQGDYDKRTPMHLAAAEGKLDVLKALMERNADVNSKDRFNQTPLDEAVANGHTDVSQHLKAAGAKHSNVDWLVTKLINAVAKGDLHTVADMLSKGIDVNSYDYDRRTPLHLAVASRNVDMCKLLLDHKADHEWKDRFGHSAYDDAMDIQSRSKVNAVQDLFHERFPAHGHTSEMGTIVKIFAPIQIIMLIIFCACSSYGFAEEEAEFAHSGHKSEDFHYLTDVYGWFMDVHVMIFIGFGFLMTFLRKYDFGAVGLTFLIGAYSIQLHILVEGLVEYLLHGHPIHITIESLILGDFSAGAVLITYGVVLGKVSPLQLMLVCTLETVFYTLNETIGLELGITDIGGSMVIHMFGAFFGLTLSLVMKKNWINEETLSVNNASVYHSDMFAMIGTVFLWMYWPSFNAVLGASDELRHLAVVNTVLSLSGSCVTAFMASHYFRDGEFCMVDIQNATLAGGVAMGTSADLYGNPGVSVLIGCIAGFVSVVGYTKLQPWLERNWGLHDTCGVNNLHGMPSLIGAIAGIIVLSTDEHTEYSLGNQALFIAVTLIMSIGTGALTGIAVRNVEPVQGDNLFQDKHYWEVPHEEVPYFFDHRGEVVREDDDAPTNNSITTVQSMMMLQQRLQVLESKLSNGGNFAESQLEGMINRTNSSKQNPL